MESKVPKESSDPSNRPEVIIYKIGETSSAETRIPNRFLSATKNHKREVLLRKNLFSQIQEQRQRQEQFMKNQKMKPPSMLIQNMALEERKELSNLRIQHEHNQKLLCEDYERRILEKLRFQHQQNAQQEQQLRLLHQQMNQEKRMLKRRNEDSGNSSENSIENSEKPKSSPAKKKHRNSESTSSSASTISSPEAQINKGGIHKLRGQLESRE